MLHLTDKQRQQYNELINEARELTADTKAFEAKMQEIEEFRNRAEEENRNIANLKTLENQNNKISNIQKNSTEVQGTIIDSTSNAFESNDIYASMDYRRAFMNHILRGTTINEFVNVDSNTKTSDVGAVIPTTVMEKIVEKMEATGMILPLITRTSYKGGLAIPISTVKPVATWTSEGSGSNKQKKSINKDAMITFSYYKLRCAVSVSFETDNVTLAIFESTLINNITEAMTKALEQSIISGSGSGQPKGILTETAPTNQALEVDDLTYETLTSAEGALPLEYEAGAVWTMTKKTFMSFIGITDSAGQPIARVNYGIGGKPERTLLGRTVVLCNYLKSYEKTVSEDTTFAFLFNFKDYVLNTNYNMTLKKYEDNDTDDMITKALMLADGKVIDNNSLVTLTKKKATS